MEALIGAAGAIAAAALTPGPNNFVVMRTAARGGLAGALSAIAGVVLGSLALLAVVVAGAGAATPCHTCARRSRSPAASTWSTSARVSCEADRAGVGEPKSDFPRGWPASSGSSSSTPRAGCWC